MALLTWNDSYSVKISLFDDQHKKLIDMINDLHDAMKVGKGKEAMGVVLGRLADYTGNHFAAEEQKMKEHAFPGYEEHKKEHNLLMVQVGDLQQRL
ncbi:MAG TPA: bacteriohemerythrin, partial [Geobacterales bacterium]|nr:bacteriohemerythrin [Geobacterales bacterium]